MSAGPGNGGPIAAPPARESAALVLVRTIAIAYVVGFVGNAPRDAFILANLRAIPALPWGPLVGGLWLWAFWAHGSGRGWPRATAAYRRGAFPSAKLSRGMWVRALVASAFASLGARMMLDLARRLSPRPGQDIEQLSQLTRYPLATALLVLGVIAATAGVVEEITFRGYLQAPLARRFGAPAAIAISALLFALAHYRTDAPDPFPWLAAVPCYLYVGVAFGILTALTGSIVPGVLGHFAIDIVPLVLYTWRGVPAGVRETGFDAAFVVRAVVCLVATAAAAWAYRGVAALARREKAAGAGAGEAG